MWGNQFPWIIKKEKCREHRNFFLENIFRREEGKGKVNFYEASLEWH